MSHLAATTSIAGRPRPVMVAASILVVLQVAAATTEFTDTIPDRWFGWIILATAALQALLAFWTQGKVTPLSDPQATDGTSLVPYVAPAPGRRKAT